MQHKLTARLRKAIENAKAAWDLYQLKIKQTETKYPIFEKGQTVLKRAHWLSNKARGFSAKLAPKWIGPFQVEKRLSPTIYVEKYSKWKS